MNQKSLFVSRRSLSAIAGLIGASVALSGAPAQAQQSEIDILRQQLVEMQARLDKLEAGKVDVKAATPFVNSASKLPVTVSGLLQFQTNNFFSQDQSSAAALSDSFRLRRGEIKLTGVITPRLTGSIMFDPAKAGSQRTVSTFTPARPPATGGTVTSTTTNNQANNPLQELVLSYQIRSDKNSPAFVDLGQYKIPVGYEGDLVSSGNIQTIERALIFRETDNVGGLNGNNAGQAGGFGDRREKGIRLRGSITPQFDYQIGAFSGLSERQNTTTDVSDQKIPIARIVFKPAGIAGLQLGISGASGTSRFAGTKIDRSIYNGFVVYKKDKITAQTEYFTGKGTILTAAETFKDVKAYYASLGYLVTPRIELVGRYDSLDREFQTDATGNKTNEITLGLNYYLKSNNAKAQVNLIRANNSFNTAPTGGFEGDNYTLRTQFQVAF